MSREVVARDSHLPMVPMVPMELVALCRGVVDYAGTFPPAKLALTESIERYARYRSGNDAWMLHRFVVSANDLEAFAQKAPGPTAGVRWPLSVVCAEPEDIERARAWRSDAGVVESLEVKATGPLAPLAPLVCELFVERPLPVGLAELQSLKEQNAMLKIRLGGERPQSTPESSTLARVLSSCAELGLPLKATAGLHQAVRSESHGFVNFLLAATLAHAGGSVTELEAILDETDATAFGFEGGHVSWRDYRLDEATISDARRLLRSFGSCSFEEPLESLAGLGLR